MTPLRVALAASLVMAGLVGTASSHTKPKHEHSHASHAYGGTHTHSYSTSQAHGHSRSHGYHHETPSKHGHHHGERHGYPRTYRKPAPPPVPGRQQDGRYVLPGGLESVCAGGTPPPCVTGQ
jgi:hypothetical protein